MTLPVPSFGDDPLRIDRIDMKLLIDCHAAPLYPCVDHLYAISTARGAHPFGLGFSGHPLDHRGSALSRHRIVL